MIRAIAIDDEPPALEILVNFCARNVGIDLVKVYTDPEEALIYLEKFPVDLLFLDINMPSISGIEFRKKLSPHIMVIFTTAYSVFAIDGFNVNAVDYLLKPFSFERFQQAVAKAGAYHQFLNQNKSAKQGHLLLRVDYSLVKVPLADILFIEGLDDYIRIHLVRQRPVVIRMTMKTLAEKLPHSEFVRVHRSFIVPLSRIDSVRSKTIFIQRQEIPIGSSYVDKFNTVFRQV